MERPAPPERRDCSEEEEELNLKKKKPDIPSPLGRKRPRESSDDEDGAGEGKQKVPEEGTGEVEQPGGDEGEDLLAEMYADRPLHRAILAGDVAEVKCLLARGGFPIECDGTPLQLAAELGRAEIAQLLIDADCTEPKDGYEFGVTPLHIAAMKNQHEIARLLLKVPFAANSPDRTGAHPIHHCVAER